jgi:CHAT domain-containing protein
MILRKTIFIASCWIFVLMHPTHISGQCQGSAALWKKIVVLRDSSPISPAEKLKILLSEEINIKKCPYVNDSTHAFLLRQIGAAYASQGNFVVAIKYFRNAITMINTSMDKPFVNHKHLIQSYYWLAAYSDSLHNVREEINALDSCAEIAMRIKSVDEYCLYSLFKLTEFHFDIGDYQRCIDYAKTCELRSTEFASSGNQRQRDMGIWYASSMLNWVIGSLLQLKQYDSAEKILTEKLNVYKVGIQYNLGVTYEQLAEVEIYKKEYSKALKYFKNAFEAEYKAGEFTECKPILNNIGFQIYYLHFNDLRKALFYYQKALQNISKDVSANNVLNNIESLNILINIADVYVRRKMFDSANTYFRIALKQIGGITNEADLLVVSLDELNRQKKTEYLFNMLIDKGDAFLSQFRFSNKTSALKDAIRLYKIADQFLDRMKAEQSDVGSKLFWRNDSRRLYENAIEACYQCMDFDNAFYFFEKSRAVLLNDELNKQNWMGEADINKQAQLERKILKLHRELNQSVNNTELSNEKLNRIFEAKKELDQMNQLIQKKNPLYYQNFIDSSKISIKDVQKNILSDHQAMVEIFEGDSAVYILALTLAKNDLIKIGKYAFDSLVQLYLTYISNSSLLNENFRKFESTAYALYKIVFGKINLPEGRIIVSPDSRYFPFESLITNSSFVEPKYFIIDHSVSYTHSARFLLNDYNTASSAEANNFMGFAPVKYASNLSLSNLNGSDYSLTKVEKNFSQARSFILSDASKSNFVNNFSKYRLIQLYTHSSENSKDDEPVIFFADSALYLSDLIVENKPSTQLVVLSACETGNGKFYKGEGVFSLNRGFAALGIPSCVTNLWAVENVSTYKLTELFYKYLAQGEYLDVAMQKAKKEFIQTGSRRNSMPCFWAAAVVTGKTNPIKIYNNFPWIVVLSLTIFIALLGFGAYYFIFRNKTLSGSGVSRRIPNVQSEI